MRSTPGSAKCSGMRAPSRFTLLDPEPRRPSVSPQSSTIVHSDRGTTNSAGPSGSGACASRWVEKGAPDAYGNVPSTAQPSSVRVSTSRGAKAAAQRKSPSNPKTSAWACSEKNDPTCSACPDARHSPQPVEGQPRAISIITFANVSTETSSPPNIRGMSIR